MMIHAAHRLLRRRAPIHELPRIAAWSPVNYPFTFASTRRPPAAGRAASAATDPGGDKSSCGTPAGDTPSAGIHDRRSPLTFGPLAALVGR